MREHFGHEWHAVERAVLVERGQNLGGALHFDPLVGYQVKLLSGWHGVYSKIKGPPPRWLRTNRNDGVMSLRPANENLVSGRHRAVRAVALLRATLAMYVLATG